MASGPETPKRPQRLEQRLDLVSQTPSGRHQVAGQHVEGMAGRTEAMRSFQRPHRPGQTRQRAIQRSQAGRAHTGDNVVFILYYKHTFWPCVKPFGPPM